MGLNKESLREPSGERRVAFPGISPVSFEIQPKKSPVIELGLKTILRELSQMPFAESKKAEQGKKQPQKETSKKDGFEPFVNPEPTHDPLFVHNYNGQQMELNRGGIEKVLKIAHLDGQVFLTTLTPLRHRSIEANPDGSVSAKRSIFFGMDIKKENDENPLYKVTSVPQGWKIEINDQKLTEELTEKKLSGKKLQKTFIKKFNKLLNKGLFECIRKEKLTSIKDEWFKRKVFAQTINTGILLTLWAQQLFQLDLLAISTCMSTFFAINAFYNIPYRQRKIDARWEYIMPLIEVDKVARSWAFLSLKGRKLVRETK